MKIFNKIILIIFFLIIAPLDSFGAEASLEDNKQVFSSQNALIHANILTYIPEENKIIAEGEVEISQKGRVLLADKVVYHQQTNIVEAQGNISMLEPDGSVYFANEMRLKDDMKQGIIEDFSARFADQTVMAANSAVRHDETNMELNNAVFSPCKVCEDYAGETPIWQIRSNEIEVDTVDETVTHHHSFLEVFGAPVFYTPYFSHPTPGAKRKSGFLTPKYRSINTLGTVVSTPYYWDISPEMDATITPIYTTQENGVLVAEYRHLTQRGQYTLGGSITNPDKRDGTGKRVSGKEIRGHIEGSGNFKIDKNWSWGFDGKRVTDDTYLARYKFGGADLLTSKAFAEKINKNNYIGIEALSFQGLNAEDDPDTTPLILPLADAHFETEPDSSGAKWSLDGNILSLARTKGVESRRISTTGAWQIPYKTANGNLFEAKTSLRGDVYEVNNVPDPSNSLDTQDGFIGRVIPEAELDWSWPFAKKGEDATIYIEPVAQFIVSPHGNNPSKIPNEDSQEIEISDNNLFSNNHFSGIDLVEGGPRTNYGVRSRVDVTELGYLDALFGQNYRTKKESRFTPESGLDKNFSDYVGRLGLSLFQEQANVNYRFRLDREDFTSRRSELESGFIAGPLSTNFGYTLLNEGTPTNPVLDRQEARASGRLKISEFWSLTGSTTRDLSEDGGFVNFNGGLYFLNECVNAYVLYSKDFTADRDIKPSTSLTFYVELIHLN